MVGCCLDYTVEDYIDLKDNGFIIVDKMASEIVGLVSSWEEVNEIKNSVSASSYSATSNNFVIKSLSEVSFIAIHLFRERIDVYHRGKEIIDFGHKYIINMKNGKIYEKVN